MTAKLIAFSGVPGSGKSTLAMELIGELRASGLKAVRINRDDIRSELFGDSYHDSAPVGWCEAKVTAFQQLSFGHFLSTGWHVISDDTNLGKSAIGSLKKLSDKHGADFEHRAVFVPLAVALERNGARAAAGGRNVPTEVIESMWIRQSQLIGDLDSNYVKSMTSLIEL